MRLKKLRETLAGLGLDAFLIGQPENRCYLSGFTGSAAWLIISAEQAILATDFRYYEQVGREAPDYQLAKIQTEFSALLPDLLARAEVRRLGYESQHLTVDQLHTLGETTEGVDWIPLKDVVETIRAVKEPSEIESIRRSAELTDAAFSHLLKVIRPGMTEREAAWEIESYMRTHGASKTAFELIVAAGPNGALPHARPGEHVIEHGSSVVADIGCMLDGYCSDMTRSFSIGEASPRYLEVWEIVHRAQRAAEEGIRAGVSGVDADALARDVIAEAGYAECFGHGLGHGVGLAIHEAPRASRLSKDILEAGMSLTIEPGIYLPGEFGVRLEDLVIVRGEGTEVLSCTPKTPVVAG